ncbi:unnamed protein product, partial [Mesorhabditis spiculigera]
MSSTRRRDHLAAFSDSGGSWRRQILPDSDSDSDSGCVLDEYAWTPPRHTPHMVHLYFASIPEDKVPVTGSAGEKWRERQLKIQHPPQDSDPLCCGPLTRDEVDELKVFDVSRKQKAFGRAVVEKTPYDGLLRRCGGCNDAPLQEGQVAVYAEKVDRWFHPACFNCQKCQTLLVDLLYYAHGNTVYCGRHHAEQFKPRCAKCDELVFCGEVVDAENRSWHRHHFTCQQCERPIGGNRYVVHGGRFMCLRCESRTLGPPPPNPGSCSTCRKIIRENEPHIAKGEDIWHANSTCFQCRSCRRTLLGRPFEVFEDGWLICQHGCREETPIASTSRYTHENGRQRGGRRRRRSLSDRDEPEQHRHVEQAALARRPPPPRTAPPPPPANEGIYETVLAVPTPEKSKLKMRPANLYSSTPNQLRRTDSEPLYDRPLYATSSDSSDDEDVYYVQQMMAAATIAKNTEVTKIRKAKRRKQTRCIIS